MELTEIPSDSKTSPMSLNELERSAECIATDPADCAELNRATERCRKTGGKLWARCRMGATSRADGDASTRRK
eukprot:4156891-Pleurochrysis_carterae.AAC.1